MGMLGQAVQKLGRVLRPIHAGDDKLVMNRVRRDRPATLLVSSAAFPSGAPIPQRYAQEGHGTSPPIQVTNAPRETRELVLICEDPDAPFLHPFVHWVVWGIAPDASLPEGAGHGRASQVTGLHQGTNGRGEPGWLGPAPPPNHGVHRYHFQVFALAERLLLSPHPALSEVVDAMRGHILAHGVLVGTYERT